MKYTGHEKIEAVKRIIEDHQSIESSARAIGMSPILLKSYVGRVREYGYGCLTEQN